MMAPTESANRFEIGISRLRPGSLLQKIEETQKNNENYEIYKKHYILQQRLNQKIDLRGTVNE